MTLKRPALSTAGLPCVGTDWAVHRMPSRTRPRAVRRLDIANAVVRRASFVRSVGTEVRRIESAAATLSLANATSAREDGRSPCVGSFRSNSASVDSAAVILPCSIWTCMRPTNDPPNGWATEMARRYDASAFARSRICQYMMATLLVADRLVESRSIRAS